MQSRRDSGVGGVALQKNSNLSQVDFGEGEPYLDKEEQAHYRKRARQQSPSFKANKSNKTVRKMEESEETYGVKEADGCLPSTSKQGQNVDTERDKDSLEDDGEDDDNVSSSSYNEEDREVQAIEGKGKKPSRAQSVSERLTRDAMSLKRHQLREPTTDPSGSDRAGEDYRKHERRENRSESKDNLQKSKRDESRKRVGDTRKIFKETHELYGDEYSTKCHLPPRSPTFSFRSTIDLLPSSHRRQGLRQQVIVAGACSLGPLACGFALAYVLAISPGEIMDTGSAHWGTYAYLIGCICGGFFSGLLVNLGRKRTLLLTMTPFALVWLVIMFATEAWMVVVFHATTGTCTGLVMVLAQVYVAEVATPGVRGAISCAPLLALQVGALICYALGNILVWRHLAAVGMGLTVPFFLTVVLCMPESPRFLVHVRPNDALATLQWLRGVEGDVMDEYRDIADNSDTDRWSVDIDDLSRPTFWRPLLLSCGLMFLYNMSGLASFGLYGMELFAEVSSQPINVSYFINTVIVIIGIIIASILVDQIGRKLLLLLSITIMAASAFTIGLFMFLKDYNRVDSYFEYQWAAEVFCVVLFTFAHGTGMGPIAWITMGEVFGPRHKWIGVTFSSMVFWSSMIAVDIIFHQLRFAVLTGGIFWFHCVMCVGGYIFVLLCFRELKEQRIDDITKSFTKKHDSLIDTFITRT